MKQLFFKFLLLLFCFASQAQVKDLSNASDEVAAEYMDSILNESYNQYNNGSFKESFELNIKLLQIALKREDDKYTSMAYGYLGYDYLNSGDTLEAIKNYQLAHQYATHSQDSLILANAYGDLGNVYATDLKTIELSDFYNFKAIEAFKTMKDTAGLQYMYHNQADALAKRGEYQDMMTILDQLNLPNFQKNLGDILISSINNMKSSYYYEIGEYNKADSVLKIAVKLIEENKINSEAETTYNNYSKNLFKLGKYKEAYLYKLKYDKAHDKSVKEKAAIETNRITAAFEINEIKEDLEKSEADLILKQEKIKSKTIFNYGLIALSIVAFLGFYLTFKLSKKRKQLNKALVEKNAQYLHEKTKTEQLSRAKSDFFSTVSHELRTPLYGVIGLSTILLENNKNESNTEDLQSLKFSADYLLALINDVLQINKIDSDKIETEEINFNPRLLIEKLVSTFEYMRRQNNNKIYIHMPSDLPVLINGNATRLSQILMNLIGNASKFTENGIIDITLTIQSIKEASIKILFSVKDNGDGIAQNKKDHIFEEFNQGDSMSYNYQGTGLGLPIVKRLLQLSDSDIHLETELGKGSDFSFELEYALVEEGFSLKNTVKKPIITDLSILKDKRILIAEDNRINQMVTRKILEKDGSLCTVVDNGQLAVDAMKNDNFDLILMDVNMPVMDGLTATKIIKSSHNIPIIALTAVEIAEMRQSILDSGMDDIIVKPYDVKVFKTVIVKNLIAP